MTYLGTPWVAYGFTRQKIHVFLATGLTHTEKEPDAEEHDLEFALLRLQNSSG